MEYKLFNDFITLQSLLKTTGILPSGGAIKAFLAENVVLFNGEKEDRRGKKIRHGDRVELPNQGLIIEIVAPSHEEKKQHEEDVAEHCKRIIRLRDGIIETDEEVKNRR